MLGGVIPPTVESAHREGRRRGGQHMRKPQIDYTAVSHALPGMVALLTPDLVYADANDGFLRPAGRTREQLLGRYIFDVFPENPNDPAAAGMRETRTSMLRAVATGERDTMALLRYDIQDPERSGRWDGTEHGCGLAAGRGAERPQRWERRRGDRRGARALQRLVERGRARRPRGVRQHFSEQRFRSGLRCPGRPPRPGTPGSRSRPA